MIVIDASLAAKWYLEEQGSEAAIDLLLAHSPNISVPDIFAIELVATLVREANMQKGRAEDVRGSLDRFKALSEGNGITLVRATPSELRDAADLAIALGHPLKDCLYLALAMELGCPIVTADARFAAKARGVYGDVRVLGVGEVNNG